MLSTGNQRGFLAYIIRDDKTKFTEHQVIQNEGDEISPPSTSCFLESEERSTFTVCVDMNQAAIFRPEEELTITIYVDGRRIVYLSPSRDSARYKIQQVSTMVSDDRGRKVEGRLIFTRLETTDDDDQVTLDMNALRHIGRIQVDLHRGKRHGLEDDDRCQAVKSDMGVASERGKKLGGVVGSIDEKPYVPVEAVDWELYDKDKPFHRFIFNYRTKPVLELMGILDIPQRPQPQPPRAGDVQPIRPRKRNSDELASEEDVEEVRDVKPGEEAILKTRLEALRRQVKAVEKRLKRSSGETVIEVVDLTGED